MKNLLKLFPVLFLALLLMGCSGVRVKGGKSQYHSSLGASVTLQQSDDPKAPSTVENKAEKTFEFIAPAGSQLLVPNTSVPEVYRNGKLVSGPTNLIMIMASNTPVKMTVREDFKTINGAAQKNVIGESIAKLNSLKWLSWVGVAMFLFGIATLFYPPLKLIVASTTTSIAIAGGGILLTILPVIVVGNEMLIFSCIFGGVAAYFFIYRYSAKATEAQIYKDFLDVDNDGIDDRLEPPKPH
jgi:hypothetical protein